jgi:hypothetical protein
MRIIDWLLRKPRPEVVMWTDDDGRLYYGNFVDHPSGKRVVRSNTLASEFVICDDDGTVKRFSGQPHGWIAGWKRI